MKQLKNADTIGVVGAGAFGTALASSFASNGEQVKLWGRDTETIRSMAESRLNRAYLPGLTLSESLHPITDLGELLDCSVLIMATPAQTTRAVLEKLKGFTARKNIVLCAKGIERDTGALQSEILQKVMPEAVYAVLSGPSFAAEIASGMPTALTLACTDVDLGARLQQRLSSERLRLYLSSDPRGVQLGGALKNVIAIGAGVITGAGFGESARAALITRGYLEMSRLAISMGADPKTLTGLSGFGDLVLTATSRQSRNFVFGTEVGRTGGLEISTTVEGFSTASATVKLAKKNGVDMPITNTVAEILSGQISVAEAVVGLMQRRLGLELKLT